jgi:hypothetical protein
MCDFLISIWLELASDGPLNTYVMLLMSDFSLCGNN